MADLTVPQINFSSLGELPQIYKQAQRDAVRQRTLAELGQGGSIDYNDAARKLLAVGATQDAMTLANLGNNQRDFQFRQQEAQRSQGNSDRSFGLQERQIATGQSNADRSFGLQQQQFGEVVNQHKLEADKPIVIQAGGGLAKRDGTIIREPGFGETGTFDDQTLTALAHQYRAGDTSVLQNLGRGAQGAANVVALRKKIADINAQAGESGSEQANRNAEFFGAKAGQRTLGTKQANIELAATEFKQVIPIVQAASDAVDRTRFSDLNKIIQSGESRTGDPNIVKFGSGVNTLINLYARAISPSGVPTVSDKDHARDILSVAWSKGQFNAAVGMMQSEIDAALQSPEKVREEMRARFKSGLGGNSSMNLTGAGKTVTGIEVTPAASGVIDYRTYFGGK